MNVFHVKENNTFFPQSASIVYYIYKYVHGTYINNILNV